MTSTTTHPSLPVPDDIAAAARTWASGLVGACGDDLVAFYVYGSALAPGFDRATNDVNLLFVVRALPFSRLEALAAACAALPRPEKRGPGEFQFAPLVLQQRTLTNSADVFPIDYLDLKDRRGLLQGEDVLADLDVPLQHLRHQCEYELRSRLIGLRQAFLRAGGAPGTAHALTVRAAGAAGAIFRHLLTLRGRPPVADPDALVREVAATYGVDPAGLEVPFLARRGKAPDEATARRQFALCLDALEDLIRAVDADSSR